jgi:hypothetical protein
LVLSGFAYTTAVPDAGCNLAVEVLYDVRWVTGWLEAHRRRWRRLAGDGALHSGTGDAVPAVAASC